MPDTDPYSTVEHSVATNGQTSSDWFVVHTKPRQEHIAQEQLERQDFEVYLPMYKILRKPRRKPGPKQGLKRMLHEAEKQAMATPQSALTLAAELDLTAHEPMFPRYLFIRPVRATQSLAVVRSTLGVTRLVLFGQKPALLSDDALQLIRKAEQQREQADLGEVSPYKPGMPVQLLDPAMAGLEALVHSVSSDRVTVLLEILGRPQKVQLGFAQIMPR